MRPRWLFWIGYAMALAGLLIIHVGLAMFVCGVGCMVYAWRPEN